MKILVLLSIVLGILLGMLPDFLFKPETIKVDEFWKINGTYTKDGELFEVFYPPLDSLKF